VVVSFSKDETQYASRLAWVSDPSDSATSLLHVGLSARYSRPDEGEIRFRSRPQAFRAPYYLDTGTFAATETYLLGPEIYYRTNRLLTGGEYYLIKADAPDAGDPILHGGEIFVSWLMSRATRPYNEFGGVFGGVAPARSVLDGGHGAWDVFLGLSYTDFDDEQLEGGIFWRLTPGVNWYLTRRVRLELVYGYGKLDRFGLLGTTQFFQNRVQLTF
jgi:phosphate-selective porin OprO/OprP